jgi:predicted patatin/cPLA2 family phospholipase
VQPAGLCPQGHHPLHHGPEFFDPMRFVRGGNLIDLDWLVETTAQKCRWR